MPEDNKYVKELLDLRSVMEGVKILIQRWDADSEENQRYADHFGAADAFLSVAISVGARTSRIMADELRALLAAVPQASMQSGPQVINRHGHTWGKPYNDGYATCRCGAIENAADLKPCPFAVPQTDVCPRCHGSGVDPLSGSGDGCAECGGANEVMRVPQTGETPRDSFTATIQTHVDIGLTDDGRDAAKNGVVRNIGETKAGRE